MSATSQRPRSAAKVRTIARVTGIEAERVMFAVEAWNEVRKIGEGTHGRGIVNLREFEERWGARQDVLV